MPLLSIILPTYNYSRYLPKCLDSILTQDFTDFELIIVNDASTDATATVLAEYAQRDARIRIITNSSNQGVFSSNERGMTFATGSYIHFFSSDDWLLPGFLKAAMTLLEAHPMMPFACSDLMYFEEETQLSTKNCLLPNTKQSLYLSPEQTLKSIQKQNFWIPGLCCIMRKETLQKYGYIDRKLENISDWFHFHKIALLEGVGYLPQFGIAMRQHRQTYTSIVKRSHKRKKATYLYLLRHIAKKENRKILQLFSQTSLLYPMAKAHRLRVLLKPCLWSLLVKSADMQRD